MTKDIISEVLYNNINYMYCDNCRYNSEITDDSACDYCHRKYNGWAISKSLSDRLADHIYSIVCKE